MGAHTVVAEINNVLGRECKVLSKFVKFCWVFWKLEGHHGAGNDRMKNGRICWVITFEEEPHELVLLCRNKSLPDYLQIKLRWIGSGFPFNYSDRLNKLLFKIISASIFCPFDSLKIVLRRNSLQIFFFPRTSVFWLLSTIYCVASIKLRRKT